MSVTGQQAKLAQQLIRQSEFDKMRQEEVRQEAMRLKSEIAAQRAVVQDRQEAIKFGKAIVINCWWPDGSYDEVMMSPELPISQLVERLHRRTGYDDVLHISFQGREIYPPASMSQDPLIRDCGLKHNCAVQVRRAVYV